MSVFQWKRNRRFRVKAQVAGEHLASLSKDGRLTPALVVRDARSKSSPLHNEFDWSVKSAAKKHWLATARRIINSITVAVTVSSSIEPISVQAYVNVPVELPSPSAPKRVYMSTRLLADDQELQSIALEEAMKSLNAWRRRFAHIKELKSIFDMLDEAQKGVAV